MILEFQETTLRVCYILAFRYQLDLCKRAVEENIVVYLGTGCGKTHIAVLLMYELGHLIRKPSREVCIFLAPTIPLFARYTVAPCSSQYIYFFLFLAMMKTRHLDPQIVVDRCNCFTCFSQRSSSVFIFCSKQW
ncbi:hypothetical protein PR202_ga19724 [Eleusine coracana subsp. coracana]|uniref:Helicase/UvrB N-terminal domain-containing protein n=1 Tax=Eleusine coracana subsp. coracana TaxID=191504 RepID=A0AAV5CX58_ELECO|nr:hypothetical protein PR202_ga19724 [Eleusine coracana subsp. coracana]